MERLNNENIERYSRQLIMPEIGVHGQLLLKSSKILIVGAGGLGCPCAQYVVAAGVGTVGIMDYDIVEKSNLHRQILHSESGVAKGITKAESAAYNLRLLNSSCKIIPICVQLTRDNAAKIFLDYDLVIDATDNVVSRYLISDVCVLTDKPLVSGSALRWEGQLTTYHYTASDGTTGPCYRCLYPKPPPPETVTNCSDGGVIGVIPGIIGCLQALEAMKIVTKNEPSFHQKLYLFDGLRGVSRTVKLRPRQPSCVCCGNRPSIDLHNLPDYASFCGAEAGDKCRIIHLLNASERLTVEEYNKLCLQAAEHILVDVRNPVELDICSLPNSFNIPINRLQAARVRLSNDSSSIFEKFEEIASLKSRIEKHKPFKSVLDASFRFPVFVVCRMGNDSQIAVTILKSIFESFSYIEFKDIKGGLMAWANQIDQSMAKY